MSSVQVSVKAFTFWILVITCSILLPGNGSADNNRVRLEGGKKYKIASTIPDLYLTAQEGVYNQNLGIVALERFRDVPQQRWEHTFHKQDPNDTKPSLSIFLPEASWYNNVTSYHPNGETRRFNEFQATEKQDLFYTLKRVLNVSQDLNQNFDFSNKNRVQNWESESENSECLQHMGDRQAVQMRTCDEKNDDQLWCFELAN